MVQTWAVVGVAALTTVANLARDLVALRRHRARRANLENLVAGATWGLRVVDRDADGAVIDITTIESEQGSVPRTHPNGPIRPGE